VPKVQPATLGALAVFVFGVLLIAAPGLIGLTSSDGVRIVGVLAMVGSAGALVWRMRDAPPTDSGPDDGAVV